MTSALGFSGPWRSKMAAWQLYLLVTAFGCSFASRSLGISVPVVFWNTGKWSQELKDVVAGQTLSAKRAFEDYVQPFLKKAQSDMTVLFIQDQLSMEDFRKHVDSFTSIAYATENNQAAMLPLVSADNQHSVSQLVRESFGDLVKDVYSSELYAWIDVPSLPEGCRLLVIHLPPVAGSSDSGRSSVLRDNDLVMKKVLDIFEGKKITLSVVVTSLAPSEKISTLLSAEELIISDSLFPRHLLTTGAVEKKTSKLYNISDCLYMSFDDIVFFSDNVSVSLKNTTMVASGNSCHAIVLDADDNLPDGLTSFTLSLNFANAIGGDWSCVNATYTAGWRNTVWNSSLLCGRSRLDDLQLAIYAPSRMSYACVNTTLYDVNGTLGISFSNLQIQPYAEPRQWGGVYNCATFFTLPILSALFVTLLLATGMIIGLLTISAIQTPDRFDDPKGPMISVPQQE